MRGLMRLISGLILFATLLSAVQNLAAYGLSGHVKLATLADVPAQLGTSWSDLGLAQDSAALTLLGHVPAMVAGGLSSLAFFALGGLFAGRRSEPLPSAPIAHPAAAAAGANTGSPGPVTQARIAAAQSTLAPSLSPSPASNSPGVKKQDTWQHSEFLPAALELLVTPPSPVAMWLMALICSGTLTALAWSYLGRIDIFAIAPGKIQPSGRSKVVQPLEPGRVVAINVENGSKVNAGDVLLELDVTEVAADRETSARELEAARAEAARRRAAIQAASQPALTPVPINFQAEIGEAIRRREADVLASDLDLLRASTASLKAQLAEKLATRDRLNLSIAARQNLIELSRERVNMRQEIETRGAGSRALVIEALQQLETHVTTDAGERGQLLEIAAAAESLQRRMQEIVSQFVADQTQKLAEIERKRDRIEQDLVKAQSKSDRTQLKAPISGTVQQLSVTTVGQVVASGQSLLTVVPVDVPIEVEAMIANKDIGFVGSGQSAIVKIDAFPFTRYGSIDATVVKISRDAVDDREASATTDVVTAAKPQGGAPSGTSRVQNLVFPATLRLARRSISIDGQEVPLLPGMSVTVEIRTGERRAIDYVLSPLREMAARSAHER